MAVRDVTITQVETGVLLAAWDMMGTGDTGYPVHVPARAKGIAVQGISASWAGTLTWQASLDGTNWDSLVDWAGDAITMTANGVKFSPVVPMWIRPSMSANAIELYCKVYITN